MTVKKNEKPGNGLQLSKNSPPEVISNYFRKILELKQTGKDFPVNLNEAWPLAYGRKEEAVRALKNNFIESVHYQSLRRNAERGAASPIDYFLSVACLEYFIASKVHPVFEVYRKVFHATIEKAEKKQNKPHVQLTEFQQHSLRLQQRYTKHPEFREMWETIESAIIACGSANELARRLGMSPSVFSLIKNSPWLVSDEKQKAVTLGCRNLIARNAKIDTETVEQLLQINDADLRMSLFTKMRKGGLL